MYRDDLPKSQMARSKSAYRKASYLSQAARILESPRQNSFQRGFSQIAPRPRFYNYGHFSQTWLQI